MESRAWVDGSYSEDMNLYQPPLLYLKSSARTGETWKVGKQKNMGIDLSTTATMEAPETVTVPAGTFTNCLKVVYLSTIENLNNEARIESGNVQDTVWYAKDVGMVKEFQVSFITYVTRQGRIFDRQEYTKVLKSSYSCEMTAAIFIGSGVASYLLGSIPTGFLWGKARGIDVRTVGSGNIGATNVMRALGKGPGIAVLLLDAAKGFLPVFLAPRLFTEVDRNALQIVCCVCVIAGHNWTCWLKFKGGKGIATSAGALLAFLPLPLLCALGVWLIVFAIWRYVSLASICAAAAHSNRDLVD